MRRIDANDLDEAAAAAVRQNLELNDSKASGLVRPTQGDVAHGCLEGDATLYLTSRTPNASVHHPEACDDALTHAALLLCRHATACHTCMPWAPWHPLL